MDADQLLGDLVSESFRNLPEDRFLAKIEDEIMGTDELICVRRFTSKLPKQGRCEIFEFIGGFVAVCSSKGMWSLYETQSRIDERSHIRNWANFSRSFWTARTPTEAGCYFCKDTDLGKRSIRELRKIEGRLIDVSGGLVPPGKVTTWAGLWWSHAIPTLPQSY